MSQPAAQNAGGGNPQQEQQQQQRGFDWKRMIIIYFVTNWVVSYFMPKSKQVPSNAFVNVFEDGEPLSFKMFITQTPHIPPNEKPVWEETGIFYNYSESNFRKTQYELDFEELVAQGENPQLYAHLLMESNRDPNSDNYTDYLPFLLEYKKINLIAHRNKKAERKGDNLLFGSEGNSTNTTNFEQIEDKKDSQEHEQEVHQKKVVKRNSDKLKATEENTKKEEEKKFPHLKSKVWIQLVHDTTHYIPNQVPPQLPYEFNITEKGNKIYRPILDVENWWLRKKDYIVIDNTFENKTINVTFEFNTYWLYKFIMERQVSQQGEIMKQFGLEEAGFQSEDQFDELKEMVTESNPYLFGLTMIVSICHSIFEFLALKNEVNFWKNLDSHKGLSLRTLWYNLVQDVIILLYLLDNDTSFVILISTFAETGVTIWKIIKTMKFKFREDGKFPFIEYSYKDSTYEDTTAGFDSAAGKYMIWALIPLLIAYAVYSLIYEKHKGWYSFVLETLVGFIYAFGFIQMTPQLYINYKLKSVEHLPWRMMIYKFLNTIIDDLFSFLITMPWLKRLSVFRDDIIFLIYLYQRYIYKVDKNRDPYGNKINTEDDKNKSKAAQVDSKKPDAVTSQEESKEEQSNIKKPQQDENIRQRQPEPKPTTSQQEPTQSSSSAKKGGRMKKKYA